MKQCTKTNLKGNSQTRWSARHLAVTALINNLPEVVEALEKIAESSLSAESKYECSHLLGAVMNFKFILTLIIWSNILREMNRVNVQIQKEEIIISRSVALMQGLIHTISEMREKSIEFWIEEATPVSKKLGIERILKSKRIPIKKRQHDEKCGDESRTLNATQLVSKEIKIIFDKILTEINTRLESAKDLNENFAFLNGYAFVNMSAEELQKHGELLARTYSRDLNILDFCQELAVFKTQAPLIIGINEKTTAFDLLQGIYKHDLQEAFPNISIALRIYCTLQTTSCERSFSKLKLIKTYLRSTMSQERLSGLAILAIENKTACETNFDSIIDSFAERKARRVKL
ncbi:zinc finger MYM-type protein 1-like [Onthophagus taurus]|uniref:zinc finger MYM-type protein 1-like n=1 Tax=Onthophagus taurus TaxID=166361 RepID=UPI0039BDE88D